MAWLAKGEGDSNFEPLFAGTHVARCISVIDVGVQETKFGGKEMCYLGFEAPRERVAWEKDGVKHEGPALIGSRYTFSIHPKSILGQQLESWRGVPFTEEERNGFSLFNVLGAPCLISVIHNLSGGKTYANINAIMRLPAGMECPPAETELVGYTPLDDDRAGNFDKLADWQQKLVRAGYKMAEGSTVIGSAMAAQQAAGGPIAPGQPAPVPASTPVPQTAAEAMEAAMNQPPPAGPDVGDGTNYEYGAGGFSDDIPFAQYIPD